MHVDDTAFEKQSALFALAIADVVLINMWCHDIGREHAANKPLLKTVFQVMMRLFGPRTFSSLLNQYLVHVLSMQTPLEKLDQTLRGEIQKIWDAVPKPEAHKSTPLSEFFNVEVTALSSYEEKEEQFKEQVAELRQRFFHSISPGGLAGDRQGVVPASGFSCSAQQIWKVIKENKDLDLPAHKVFFITIYAHVFFISRQVMVATVRCEEIANEKLRLLSADKGWLALKEAIKVGPVPGFGKKLSSILYTYLSEYDMETIYFDEDVRTAKGQHLESKALDFVHPAYGAMLGHLRSKAFDSFKTRLEQLLNKGEAFAASDRTCYQSCMLEFDQGCADAAIRQANWDASKVREKLRHDIDAHKLSVRNAKLSEIIANYEKKLNVSLIKPLESLFEDGSEDTWPSIRRLLKRETEAAVLELSNAIAGFRFSAVFKYDKDSMPRHWTEKEDIRTVLKDAQSASLRLLSVMAAIRLDVKPDKIENLLFSSLMDGTVAVSSTRDRSIGASADPLASSTWEEVSRKDMLITPVQCKSLWKQFEAETVDVVTEAILAQEIHKLCNNRPAPTPTPTTAAASILSTVSGIVSSVIGVANFIANLM
ncbi:hypothetical protein Pint_11631 [Pistacia integerrima]|uniref:Uncharacterized protein n=1 Tax=Pistacia integerrima TaxID=434235 RepID=A0ACC0XMT6_9ROSI|nr:hypothetical protein Pint_11631 [Pistacia integerrima]